MPNLKKIALTTFILFSKINCLKIDRVILSTDNNPTYIEFWPIVAKVWKEFIGIKPTLALIANKTVQIDESIGEVIRFEPIKNVPIAMQAQCIRLLLPAYFEEDVCLTSDIDMIPVNKFYFSTPIKDLPDDKFVVYKNGYYEYYNYQFKLPICYNASKGKIFKEIFKINDIKDIPTIIKSWSELNLGWETDELMLYKYLHDWQYFNTKCVKLGHYNNRRIDRLSWKYSPQLLRSSYYIDAHCLRPYNQYKKEIDELINHLMKTNVNEKTK